MVMRSAAMTGIILIRRIRDNNAFAEYPGVPNDDKGRRSLDCFVVFNRLSLETDHAT